MKFILGGLIAGSAFAQPHVCKENPLFEGACIECGVSYESAELLKGAPPLYWDLCKNEAQDEKLVYFLPSSLLVHVANGKKKQSLRRRADGTLLLVASLGYAPWSSPADLESSRHLLSIKARYANTMFKPLVPTSAILEFLGDWKNWVDSYKLNAPGLDYFAPQGLTIVFKPEFAQRATYSLQKNLGILGQVKYTYNVVNKTGEKREIVHIMPIFLGGLRPPNP